MMKLKLLYLHCDWVMTGKGSLKLSFIFLLLSFPAGFVHIHSGYYMIAC